MISGVCFSRLVLLILTCSDQALRKPRITSALFVCWRGRSKARRPCSWREVDKGIFQSRLPNPTENHLLPSACIEYRFSITCPLSCSIHPKQLHYVGGNFVHYSKVSSKMLTLGCVVYTFQHCFISESSCRPPSFFFLMQKKIIFIWNYERLFFSHRSILCPISRSQFFILELPCAVNYPPKDL